MIKVRPLLLLLLVAATPAAARRRHAAALPASPVKFTTDSGLSADAIVACLETRRKKPSVLRIDDKRRVLLGTAQGWIDVYDRPGGSRLQTRTEWIGGPEMERWTRACAAGQPPRPRGFLPFGHRSR